MLGNSTTTQTTQHAPAHKPDASQKLEQVRNRVRFALRAAEEGPLTVSTADDIARSLTAAMRDLEALQLTVAVMERKVR
jgi:hypothetical protein